MEDHHVDRPGVDVRQRMKLTGPNRSYGLIEPQDPRTQPQARAPVQMTDDRCQLTVVEAQVSFMRAGWADFLVICQLTSVI